MNHIYISVRKCISLQEIISLQGLASPPRLPSYLHPHSEGERRDKKTWDISGGAVVKSPPANAGDTGSIPGPGRSHMPWSN